MIDVVVVGAYLGVMLLMGWRSRLQSAESYWVADRRYTTGPIAASLVATIFGASSTLGIIGLGYSRGLTGAWWSLIGAVALVPFGLFLADRVRSLGVYTLPDILRHAYGHRVSIPAAVMISIAWCGVVAAQIVAGARLLSGIFPLEFSVAVVFVAMVFTLYTLWGGQLSVIRTDIWQIALFLGGLVVSLVVLVGIPGRAASFWGGSPETHWDFPVAPGFGWYEVLVFYPLIVGLPYLVGPDIYSRVLCARDGRVARRSILAAAAVVVPVSFLLAILGLAIRAQFPSLAAEAALPHAVDAMLPVGLKGLVVAGFLAAIMSSADTTLVSASTILSLNVVAPTKKLAAARRLRTTKIAVVAIGAAASWIAMYQQSIIASLLLGYTVFVGGVVVPTLASFYRDRLKVTASGALWAVLVGGTLAILGAIGSGRYLRTILTPTGDAYLASILGPQYPAILPVLSSLVALMAVSRMSRSD
jgi:SSS family solute:Na+ symporter